MYSIGEFAKLINKSVKTLQRWDRNDIYKPHLRTKTNRRQYTHQQYLDYIGHHEINIKINIAYCRVSSSNQKNDLKSQKEYLNDFTRNKGIEINDFITEIGSGLNYKRPKFLKIIKQVLNHEINNIIIAHKDRLMRFGFEIFEFICKEFDTKIIIINDERLSPEEEVTKDLMSIINVFSSRLYGLRKDKKKIKEICENKK